MQCPKCGFNQSDTNVECDRCGVIFSKLGTGPVPASVQPSGAMPQATRFEPHEGPPDRPVASPKPERAVQTVADASGPPRIDPTVVPVPFPVTSGHAPGPDGPAEHDDVTIEDLDATTTHIDEFEPFVPEPRHMEANDWLVLGSGAVLAVVVMCFPMLNHVFHTFTILVHEMGHAITGWVFGYPSFPAFDLCYGGGVTLHTGRSTEFVLLFYVFAGALIFRYRTNALTVLFLSFVVAVHIILSVTWVHEALMVFMGHGTELVIAAIFFYRGLSGAAGGHSAERPLYCLIACFIVFSDVGFAYRLRTSAEERALYGEAKGGGHWMDFSRLADDYFHTSLSTVAFFFFICCLLPLIAGFLMFRYQEYLRYGVERLFSRHASEHTR